MLQLVDVSIGFESGSLVHRQRRDGVVSGVPVSEKGFGGPALLCEIIHTYLLR
jgi:hypothetical protein